MGVDLLPGGGRAQPFYRVLVSAASSGALQGAGAGAEEGEGEEREAEGQQRQQGAVQAAPAAVAGAGGGGGDGGGAGGGWRGQVWAPFGGASKLTGLHHKLLAQVGPSAGREEGREGGEGGRGGRDGREGGEGETPAAIGVSVGC